MHVADRGTGRALVVIPTYNEADNIRKLIPIVLGQDPRLDILVVDDGSPDGTAEIVRGFMQTDQRVQVLVRKKKMGLGTAYVAGFRYAIEQGYDFVFEMDADFSHDPKELVNFLAATSEADLVLGSRYLNGVRVLNWPMRRLLLSYFANIYTRIMTGMPLHDATGGFKCYRIAVLKALDLEKVRSNGYAFQIELSFKAWRKGFRLKEIPIVFHDRTSGQSKMSREIIYEAIFMLWSLRINSFFNRL